jgi:hypothetical protein
METAGYGIAAAAELTAGVKCRENHLDSGHLFDRVLVDRNTSTVVGDADSAISKNYHVDQITVTGKRLIHRVIDDLIDQVVKTPRTGGPDVHTGPLTHCL